MRKTLIVLTVLVAFFVGTLTVPTRTAPAGLAQGVWFPAWGDETYQASSSTYVMDLTGERVTVTFYAPRSGDIEGAACLVGAVGNAPDNGLRISLQNVSLTDGIADGTILGGTNAFVDTAAGQPAAAGWLESGDFAANETVVTGELVALAIEFITFVALDSVSFGSTNHAADIAVPFATSATNTKQASNGPICAVRYSDNTYENVSTDIWPYATVTDYDIDTGTTPDEVGSVFDLPFPYHLDRVGLFMINQTGALWDLVVYDAANNVLSTQSIDPDVVSSTSQVRWSEIPLATPVDIDTELIRVVMKPTTTTNARLVYYTFSSLAIMNVVPGGADAYATERTNAGSWTDHNSGTFRRARVSIHMTEFDDGASVGGFIPFISQ